MRGSENRLPKWPHIANYCRRRGKGVRGKLVSVSSKRIAERASTAVGTAEALLRFRFVRKWPISEVVHNFKSFGTPGQVRRYFALAALVTLVVDEKS
jgi:hypothetical protein